MNLGESSLAISQLQRDLASLGYYTPSNGIFEEHTLAAVRKFQMTNGMVPTGNVDSTFLDRVRTLLTMQPKAPPVKEVPDVRVVDATETQLEVLLIVRPHNASTLKADFTRWKIQLAPLKNVAIRVLCPLGVNSLEGENAYVSHYIELVEGFNEWAHTPRSRSVLYPVFSDTLLSDSFCKSIWPMVVACHTPLVVCDWGNVDTGEIVKATEQSIQYEDVPFGSFLFLQGLSGLPSVSASVHPSLLDRACLLVSVVDSEDHLGYPVSVISTKIASISRGPIDITHWASQRASIIYTGSVQPRVSALMITGKDPARYPLARVAIKCFLNQTWHNKELIIVNHGDRPVCQPHPQITQIKLHRGQRTLGDLRNLSIKYASGPWCMTWDDDDWHHPRRIETQMRYARKGHINTFTHQVRCSFSPRNAFYDYMPTGQQMSVLFDKHVPHRYAKLEAREDTHFIEAFGSRVTLIKNTSADESPLLYVRFYHGRNIWGFDHIMHGSDAQHVLVPNRLELTPQHQAELCDVIRQYEEEPGFSYSNVHPGNPE